MISRLALIFKTFTFRLGLIYVGLFSFSVVLLFAFIYTFSMNYVQSQVSDNIRLQYYALQSAYDEGGTEAAEQRIKQLIAEDDEGSQIYILTNREQEKIVGNLVAWPQNLRKEGRFEREGQWVHFLLEGTKNYPAGVEVNALIVPLSKWRNLLVGQTLRGNDKISQTIIQTFWASLIVTVFMALVGAVVMTRSMINRINVINRSAVAIMHGDLSARVPFTSGGDEFDELSSNLNQMLDKIDTLLQSLALFANNIAHDLRSPLTRVITRIDAAIRTQPEGSEVRDMLTQNKLDLQALVGTFNSILKISALEAKIESHALEPCDLASIAHSMVDFYEPLASEKHIRLTCQIADALPVLGERNLLSQALANIIDNAIKFTPEGGQVHMEGQVDGARVLLSVADSGPGIPEEFRKQVFDKFFRLEQSRHTKGNGLGLSLVAAIARIHGATITLSDHQPGLKVTLRFKAI